MPSFKLPFLSPSSFPIQAILFRFNFILIIFLETIHCAFDLLYSLETHHTLLLFRYSFTLACLVSSSTSHKQTEQTKSKFLDQYSRFSLLKSLALLLELYSAFELGNIQTLYEDSKEQIFHIILEGTWKLYVWDQIFPKQFVESHHIFFTIYLFCLDPNPQRPFLFTLRVLSQSISLLPPALYPKQLRRIKPCKNPILQEEINIPQDLVVLSKALQYLPEGMAMINSKKEIKFSNQSLRDILKLHCNFSFLDLNKNIFDLKLSNILPTLRSNLAFKNQPAQSFADLHVGLHSTSFSEKIQSIQNLGDLFSLYMDNTESPQALLEYSPVFTAKGRDNEEHSLELRFHMIFAPDNTEKILLVFIKDLAISEQKTLLLEKEKLLYRDNLVASFSHELKTPLNSMLGFLEQAMDCSLIPSEVKQRLIKPALNSGKLLFLLVSDILDYSLILSNQIQLKITPRNMKETVNHCLELVNLKALQKGLKIKLDIEEDVPNMTNTDHKRFSQVLINLLNNSIQYTLKGEINISITQSSENTLLISVQDTGIGMNLETQRKVMNSLMQNELEGTANNTTMGIGLGLFISNKLAQMLNSNNKGGLRFVSERDVGSTFYFEIKDHGSKRINQYFEDLSPKRIISGLELEPKTSLNIKIRQYNTRRIKNTFYENSHAGVTPLIPKVLIVDDEIFNINILENYCKSFGISTETAFNGEEALKKLSMAIKANKAPYGLIFMDINMPVMDGYQTTRKIGEMIKRGQMEDVVIIGVTAYVGWNKIEEGYKSGMTEILSKPVSKETIMNILKKYKVL